MPDLSACYFCGAAADARVREYDVVPETIDETLQSTATLCPGCREKLETVLATVARGAGPTDEPVDVDLRPVDGEIGDADSAPTDDPLDLDSEKLFEPDDPVADAPSDRPEGSTDASSGGASGGSDEAIAFDADAGSTEDSSSDGETDSSANAGAPAETGAGQPADGQAPPDSDAEGAAGSGRSAADASAQPSSAAGGDPDASGRTDAAAKREGRTDSAADVERPDAQTYNKIIRLLQNREFPVNRSKFSELATSAYDVDPGECADVIDYAIHRGELREDRGMLKKP